jgi:hypothetical protein
VKSLRSELEGLGLSPRTRAVLERAVATSQQVEAQQAVLAQATDRLEQATVITLSPNAAFTNERVLLLGDGLEAFDAGNTVTISLKNVMRWSGNFTFAANLLGNTSVVFPLTGQLATLSNVETLQRKTLDAPKLSGLGNYANDAAAATGGVPVGGVYRNGSALQVRVT